MRILQAYSKFYPASASGGTVKLAYEICKELVIKQHEVTFYTSDAVDRNTKMKDTDLPTDVNGITVYYAKSLCYSQAWKYKIFIMPQLINIAKKEIQGFDVIHLHECRGFLPTVIHHYAKKYGVPYILDTHGSLPRFAGGKRGVKWLLKWLFDVVFGLQILRDADKCVAETELGVNEYEEFGIDKGKIALIPPPFDTEAFSKLPPYGLFCSRYNVEDKRIILFLGRINWIKGIDFLVESFSELAQSRSDAILVIVGPDDGFKPTLDKLIGDLDLSDRVLFTGFLDGEEKLSALVDADVMVQTSIYEQGAWAPFEAVLCNTPIIVSSNSGAGEDVRRIDAGYLVEYGNKKEFADMMQYVLTHSSEAQSKTKKAKEYIETNLSMASGVKKYEKLYKDMIGGCNK